MSTTLLKAKQVLMASGIDLETFIAALVSGGSGSLTLGTTIIKWGSTGGFSSINANTVATLSFNFPVAFPTQCDAVFILLTPNTSTDFYGVTSIVSKSKTGCSFTARNGATAQTISGGVFIAIGS